MAAFWWGAAVSLTLVGALVYWGADVLRREDFNGGAALLLVAALLCAGLAQTWTWWAVRLGLPG